VDANTAMLARNELIMVSSLLNGLKRRLSLLDQADQEQQHHGADI
jgi:hypothetical protein